MDRARLREMVKRPGDESIPDEVLDGLLAGAKTEQEIAGPGGLLAQLTKRLVERAMEVELTDHLGYEPHQEPPGGAGNSRICRVRHMRVHVAPRTMLRRGAGRVDGRDRAGGRARSCGRGRGARRTNRSGLRRRRRRARRVVRRGSASARPWWTVDGVITPTPGWRCWSLYQAKNWRQNALASRIEVNRAGNPGRYFSVLNCASE